MGVEEKRDGGSGGEDGMAFFQTEDGEEGDYSHGICPH
jgi:hypothetical protein